jgi:hypothetical protein
MDYLELPNPHKLLIHENVLSKRKKYPANWGSTYHKVLAKFQYGNYYFR